MNGVAVQTARFFANYREKRFEKGEVLVQSGNSPDGVYFVVSGQVRQYDISANGNVAVVNVFRAGAFFPISWAIHQTPNQYIFDAFTDVVVRKAPARDVVSFLRENPDVTFDLLSRVLRGAEGLQRRMVFMMENNALRRLLSELLLSAERFGELRDDDTVFVAMGEGELAVRVGLARETASRAPRGSKKTGLMVVTRKGIIVRSLDALRKALDLEK